MPSLFVVFSTGKERENLDIFVNVGCNYWHNSNERKLTYTERNYNKDVIAEVQDLFNHSEMAEGTIDNHENTVFRERCSV